MEANRLLEAVLSADSLQDWAAECRSYASTLRG